jgi:putative Mg2+ transporter-C (MgtC) family protein
VLDILELSGWEMVLRVLLALVLGGAIGVDREIDGQQAGFRTHVLVCLGAALFGLLSAHAFDPFVARRANTNVQVDVTRVASQVVVGIGFLGGGAILKYGATVRGLTTAASMWVTAAIGLAVGLGFYWPAVAVTVATLATLVAFRGLREWIRRHFARHYEVVTFRLEAGADAAEFVAALHATSGINVRRLQVDRDGEQVEVVAGLRSDPGVRLDVIAAGLADRPDVDEMSMEER